MDKKLVALLGAAAAFTTVGNAQAMTAQAAEPASNYRDLLEPIPNALVLLREDDARRANAPAATRLSQYYYHDHHHHHHHHHAQYYPQPYYAPPPPYGYYRGGGTYNGCPPHFTRQDGVCKPYRGY